MGETKNASFHGDGKEPLGSLTAGSFLNS